MTLDWPWVKRCSWVAAQIGSLLIALFSVGLGVKVFVDLRAGRCGLGTPDYAGFYAAATILNDYPASRLYDRELQDRILHSRVPTIRPDRHFPFAHTPVVAVVVRPLARLPFAWSYAVWLAVLTAIAAAGLKVCQGLLGWPRDAVRGALLLAAAFPPLASEGWLAGQWCVVGLFWVALTLRLLRADWPFAAGLALSMCAVKPTLLMFVAPVVLLSGRIRLVAGAAVGGVVLAAICLLAIGPDGALGYVDTLLTYSRRMSAGAEGFKIFKHVDLHSFFVMLYGGSGRLPRISVLVMAAGLVPPLLAAWWFRAHRGGDWQVLALCATLTGNILFSAYTPIYDVSLLIPNVLLTGDLVYRCRAEPRGQTWWTAYGTLVAMLLGSAWITQESALACGFQPLTLVLLAWAWFQVALLWRGPLPGAPRQADA